MSKFTTEVRYICEYYAGKTESCGYDDIDDIIEDSMDSIFEDYPIFDEDYRDALNKKILRHYYMNEIGMETVGLWKLYLNNTMNEIMPYYNQLYKSALLEFDPLADISLDTTRTSVGERDSNTSSNGTSSSDTTNQYSEDANGSSINANKATSSDTTTGNAKTINNDNTSEKASSKFSDTPQGALNAVEAGTYLTNATIEDRGTLTSGNTETDNSETSNSSNESTGNSTTTNKTSGDSATNTENVSASASSTKAKTTDQYVMRIAGKRSATSYSELLQKFRKTFLNIDMLVIKDLDKLFMHIW